MIVHYQLPLFIVHMSRFDHFILFSLYNFYILIQLSLFFCHYFYKNILTKLNLLLIIVEILGPKICYLFIYWACGPIRGRGSV